MTSQTFGKHKFMVAAASALALALPAQQAEADAGKAIAGAIVGGIAVCAVTKACGKKQTTKRSRTTTQRAPQPWSAQRQERASVQRALNDFGFPVGSADGVYGSKTRAGVSNYQAYMGYPITGELLPYQQQSLLNAHNTYTSGAANSLYPGLLQAEGPGGLLKATADPNYYHSRYGNGVNQYGGAGNQGLNYGNQNANLGGQGVNYGTQQQPPVQNNLGQNGHNGTLTGNGAVGRAVEPNDQGLALGGGALAPLPSIGRIGQVSASMQDHCDLVKLTTQTNGGQILANSMTDADQALSEQFCDARTYLMGQVQSTLSVARATEDELLQACGTVEASMKPVMGGLSSKGSAAVIAETSGISGQLGLTDPQAATEYGEVCLGLGYRSNNSEMALAGALMLTAAGRAPYAEMVGHHVREGFGTSANPDAAGTWYDMGLEALANNQAPAVLPSQTIQRTAIIRAAVTSANQRASATQTQVVVPVANQLQPLNLGNN